MKTQDTRKLPAKTKETIRIRAVQKVLDGKTQAEVARIFGVTRQSVGNWMKAYHENGLKALEAKK
jgi:transposase